ncbi:MAG: hypothetical protein UR89_C0022G0006 [Candidatus Roizmanbacteria bacterium GW2011_GWA2_35_8]|uniref:Mannosyl-glycoprotein endo-beta-N-acetylglucosamidase-like domain-containing protein n=1 Tax=Candidatus Roizmanbacteria bacterium GW2011_GWA2_35_8 TaxID=1618479 RepID=A0A0G0DCP9_9BACT|nr:MAG: hypothetical protein UR89_C0022G0006 [Candidatus Roizmanbacteria bacterium GW2011_GWA2_35_8]
MKKLIYLSILVTILLFTSPSNTMANTAGTSADLALSSKISSNEIKSINMKKKRMAIEAVLRNHNSPLLNDIDSFMDTCQKYDLDCYLLPSISGIESTFGKFIYPNSFNPFGWGRGLIIFENWATAIDTVGQGLRVNYMDKWGATTVEEIGRIYCEGNTWASKVNYFMNQFKTEEEKIALFSSDFPVKL